MNIGITVYPTYGGSGIVGSELGKELAERDEIGIGFFREPLAADDELVVEVAEMCDRTAEAREPESEEDEENFPRRAALSG